MNSARFIFTSLIAGLVAVGPLRGDGPKDNLPANVRPIPPVGIEVPAEDREALQRGLDDLRAMIQAAASAQAKNPALKDLLPDIEIYWKAVDWALRYQEIHTKPEIKAAQELIREGMERLTARCNPTAW